MRRIRLVLVWMLCQFAAAAQIPTAGMIGGWPFSGNANDMSGAGNHGNAVGAVLTADRFGAPNAAYHLDGINDYIVMQSAGPTGSMARSVSFWSRTANSAIQVPFGYGEASTAGGIFQVVYNYNCTGAGFDNSQAAFIRGNTNLVNNQWHHVVLIYDASQNAQIGAIRIYVDGVLQPQAGCNVGSLTSTINSNSLWPVTLGRSSNAFNRFYQGDIDDFYFYNRALTETEVLQLKNYSPCDQVPAAPGPVMGSASVCLGTTNMYSVSPVTGATHYTWYLPGGWTGSSSTNTIMTTASVAGGNISAAAGNGCGMGPVVTKFVAANICTQVPRLVLSELRISSNPGSSFTIEGLDQAARFEVFDLAGNKVVSEVRYVGETRALLDLSVQPSGVYLLRVTHGDATAHRRLIRADR